MITKILKYTLICMAMFTFATNSFAQVRKITKEEYIATYAPLAIEHQKVYGIPASIKMAQGIIESAYGNSDLTRMSNNHFGIKCKSNWTGMTHKYDDDAPGECFRGYETSEESYRDHSEFLKNSPRYSELFTLKVTDYKGWAHGLKKAGYATAPHYAQSLIKCIEENELYLLDEGEYPAFIANVEPVTFLDIAHVEISVEPVNSNEHVVFVHMIDNYTVFSKDGYRCIIAKTGESYSNIAKKIGIPERRLRRYNNKPKDATIATGEVIFIEKVKNKA